MNTSQSTWYRKNSLWVSLLFLFCTLGVGIAQDLGSKQAAASSPALSQAEMEEFLLKAKVVERKELSMGVTNSQQAVLDDGKFRHNAHIQTVDISKTSFQTSQGTEANFRDSYKFNMAGYELDKLLGLNMVPPSVERKVAGHSAAVTWWIDDGMVEKDRIKNKIEPPDQHRWNQQMFLCRLFDQLIFNTDRNLGNLVITKDWKIWMIDHTRAFRMLKELPSPQNLAQCDRKLLAKLRELDKATLTQKLGRYLDSMEIQGILGRRDKIVKFFDDQIAQKGEANVLFDMAGNL